MRVRTGRFNEAEQVRPRVVMRARLAGSLRVCRWSLVEPVEVDKCRRGVVVGSIPNEGETNWEIPGLPG